MLYFIIGMALGFIVACIGIVGLIVGVLKIDHSDPEKDLYRFEIEDLDKLSKRKMIVLKIDHNADLSQK